MQTFKEAPGVAPPVGASSAAEGRERLVTGAPEGRETPARTRVAILSSEFPPKWGGVGNEVYYQVNHLAGQHPVRFDVFTRTWPGTRPVLPDAVAVHEVPWRRLPMAFTTSFGTNAIHQVLEEASAWHVCHVHSNMTLLPAWAYDRLTMPIVTSLHGTWKGERSRLRYGDIAPNLGGMNDLAVRWLSPFYDKYEDLAIRRSDVVLVECLAEMEAIRQRGLVSEGETVLLSPGVDTDLFHPSRKDPGVFARQGIPADGPKALFVGRLAGRKGLDTLLAVVGRGLRKVPDLRLVVVGTGPLEARMRRDARRAGIDARVHFLSDVPLTVLASLYASVDLVLYPTRWEGFGLVPLEGMAAGTPAVATTVGGIPEYIANGRTGLLAPVDAVPDLTDGVVTLATDHEARDRMGAAARTVAEGRSLKAWAEEVFTIYRRLAEAGGKIRGRQQ